MRPETEFPSAHSRGTWAPASGTVWLYPIISLDVGECVWTFIYVLRLPKDQLKPVSDWFYMVFSWSSTEPAHCLSSCLYGSLYVRFGTVKADPWTRSDVSTFLSMSEVSKLWLVWSRQLLCSHWLSGVVPCARMGRPCERLYPAVPCTPALHTCAVACYNQTDFAAHWLP